MTTFLILLLIALSILMVLVVLVQRGRGGGLSGAFGSGGGSNSAFGTKTGDVFTTVTVILFVAFMLLAIALTFRFKNAAVVPGSAAGAISATLPAGPLAIPPENATGTAPVQLETPKPATATATTSAPAAIAPLTRPGATSAPR